MSIVYCNDPKILDTGLGKQCRPRLLLESDQGLHCLLFHLQQLEVSDHDRTSYDLIFNVFSKVNEPRREKTGFLHMQKQRRRSASR